MEYRLQTVVNKITTTLRPVLRGRSGPQRTNLHNCTFALIIQVVPWYWCSKGASCKEGPRVLGRAVQGAPRGWYRNKPWRPCAKGFECPPRPSTDLQGASERKGVGRKYLFYLRPYSTGHPALWRMIVNKITTSVRKGPRGARSQVVILFTALRAKAPSR